LFQGSQEEEIKILKGEVVNVLAVEPNDSGEMWAWVENDHHEGYIPLKSLWKL